MCQLHSVTTVRRWASVVMWRWLQLRSFSGQMTGAGFCCSLLGECDSGDAVSGAEGGG